MVKVSSSIVVLAELPFPPSENNAYVNRKAGGRFASKEVRDFKHAMSIWRIRNNQALAVARQAVFSWKTPPALKLVLGFRHDRVWTKDGSPKRIDAANFVKVLQDSVAAVMAIDDSKIWSTMAEKAPLEPESKLESAMAILTPAMPMGIAQWKDHLGIV